MMRGIANSLRPLFRRWLPTGEKALGVKAGKVFVQKMRAEVG